MILTVLEIYLLLLRFTFHKKYLTSQQLESLTLFWLKFIYAIDILIKFNTGFYYKVNF